MKEKWWRGEHNADTHTAHTVFHEGSALSIAIELRTYINAHNMAFLSINMINEKKTIAEVRNEVCICVCVCARTRQVAVANWQREEAAAQYTQIHEINARFRDEWRGMHAQKGIERTNTKYRKIYSRIGEERRHHWNNCDGNETDWK